MCKKLGKGGKKPTWVNKEVLSLLKYISRKCTRGGNRVIPFAINIEGLSEYIEMRQGRSSPIHSDSPFLYMYVLTREFVHADNIFSQQR